MNSETLSAPLFLLIVGLLVFTGVADEEEKQVQMSTFGPSGEVVLSRSSFVLNDCLYADATPQGIGNMEPGFICYTPEESMFVVDGQLYVYKTASVSNGFGYNRMYNVQIERCTSGNIAVIHRAHFDVDSRNKEWIPKVYSALPEGDQVEPVVLEC